MRHFLDQNVLEDIAILFVDDDEDFLNLLGRKAESSDDLNHFTCSNPEEAEKILEEKPIDCIVSDYKMSKMTGLELLEHIREKELHLPFILFTGKGSEEIASAAMSKGVTDYIVKKEGLNRFGVLENRIKNAVENRRSEQAAQRMLDRVTDAFFALDDDWNFTYVNEEAVRLLQSSREKLIGESIWDVLPGTEDSKFGIKYKQAMDNQEPVYFEGYYPTLDAWFSVKAYPSETGLSVYFRDVTDSRKREKQLKRKVDQQEATTDLLRMALEGEDVLDLQHAAAEMVAERLDNSYAQILKLEEEDDQLILAATYGIEASEMGMQIMDVEEKYQEGYTLTSKDPVVIEDFNTSEFERSELLTFLNARSGISVIVGEYDDPWGILTTHSMEAKNYSQDEINFVQGIANILASTLENQKQRLKLKEYERAINSVKDGIFMLDNRQRIIMVNEAFRDMSGYEEGQLLGQEHPLEDAMSKDTAEMESELERSDGQKVKVKTHLAPVELPDGTTGRVAIVREED